jgi:hypothetical protein
MTTEQRSFAKVVLFDLPRCDSTSSLDGLLASSLIEPDHIMAAEIGKTGPERDRLASGDHRNSPQDAYLLLVTRDTSRPFQPI